MDLNTLYNFISPITGRILCDYNHVLVGNIDGIAIPSLVLPSGILPLQSTYLYRGNMDNIAEEVPNITIENMANLSFNKIWIGNNVDRPVEGDPPRGKDGKDGKDGRDAFDGSAGGGSSILSGLIGGAIGGALVNATGFNEYNSIAGAPGQDGAAYTFGQPTIILNTNLNLLGGRLENIAQSPLDDFDAITAKWVWDLLNDNVKIIWEN